MAEKGSLRSRTPVWKLASGLVHDWRDMNFISGLWREPMPVYLFRNNAKIPTFSLLSYPGSSGIFQGWLGPSLVLSSDADCSRCEKGISSRKGVPFVPKP